MRRSFLLPVVFGTYSLAYLDRANFGFGTAAGMAATLHITQGRAALLSALFFLGYFAFQIPGMRWVQRVSPTRVVFALLIVWGVVAALTGVARSFLVLAVLRLLLGVAESLVFPAMLLLLTRWFTRAERSRANTMLILGNPTTVLWMSALTGFLIEHLGWQRTFIVEGLPAVLWAFVWVFTMRDRPEEAKWFPPEAAEQLARTIREEQGQLQQAGGGGRPSLLRGDLLLLSVQYFCWSLGVYGFVLWLPTIVRRGGALSMGQTGLLAAIPYLLATVLMLVVAHASDRKLRREMFVWPFLLLAGVAMLGSFWFAETRVGVAFVCLVLAGGCMYAPYGPFFAIIPERVPHAIAGEAFALVNSAGALGGFAGSYLVGLLHSMTGTARAGDLLMALALVASAVLLLLLRPMTPLVSAMDQAVPQVAGGAARG